MSQGLSGPGVGLPPPQKYYPSQLQNAPQDPSSNRIALAPGDTFVIPAGNWYIELGSYLVLQYQDPVNGQWTAGPGAAWTGGVRFIKSDGFTTRIANLTGCLYSLTPTAYGSSYVQASTQITFTGLSGAAATPIVGGQLGGITVSSAGAGYGVPPIVLIPPPPNANNNANGVGGVQASAFAVIANGTISAVSMTNPGAGYPTAPTAVIVPAPFDPNLSVGITQGTVTFSLVGSGSVTGALITNNGAPVADGSTASFTVAVSGAGTGATLVGNILQTVKAVSVVGTGTGYGSVALGVTSVGGGQSLGTITNGPPFLGLAFRPRPLQAQLTVTALGTLAAQTGTIIDGGLFLTPPNVALGFGNAPGGTLLPTGSTVSFVMGSRPDIMTLQPAP